MIRQAVFPSVRSFDDFDLSRVNLHQSISRDALLAPKFIERRHSLIMYGACGTDKTALFIFFGMLACERGCCVRLTTLSQLALCLRAAKREGLGNYLQGLRKMDILMTDEWGYTLGCLFQIVTDSYKQKSLIVMADLPFSEWGRIFADEQLAATIIDRHSIDTGTKDWRLSHSPMSGKTFIAQDKTVGDSHGNRIG